MNEFILYVTIVLLAGIAASKVSERLRISDVILLLLVGLILGPEVLDFLPESQIISAGNTIRDLALVIIVFDAGYHISWRILKKEWLEVTKYVTIGCIFIMAVSAAFAHALFGIPYALALLFGAIVSATDPSATLSMLRDTKITPKVKDTLEAESIANDPTGIILTFIVLEYISSPMGLSSINYGGFAWLIATSIAVGISGGVISRLAAKHLVKNYSVIFSLAIALATYAAGDLLGGSGIFAAATAGIILGHQTTRNKRTIVQFDDEMAVLMKIGIFVYLGAIIKFDEITSALIPGIVFSLALLFIIRPAMILAFASPKKFTLNERLYMGLAGPIAVVPAALAPLLLPFPGGERMAGAVFVTIVATIVVVGGLLNTYNRILLGVKKRAS